MSLRSHSRRPPIASTGSASRLGPVVVGRGEVMPHHRRSPLAVDLQVGCRLGRGGRVHRQTEFRAEEKEVLAYLDP